MVIYEIIFSASYSSSSENFYPVCHIKYFRSNITRSLRYSNDIKEKGTSFLKNIYIEIVALYDLIILIYCDISMPVSGNYCKIE